MKERKNRRKMEREMEGGNERDKEERTTATLPEK